MRRRAKKLCRMHWLLFPRVWWLVCLHILILALTVESRAQEEPYYEYVHKRLQWNAAAKLCNVRSGALATVSRPLEDQELTNFLNSLNITQPVWIARKVMTNPTSSSQTLVLEFTGHSENYAHLHPRFQPMDSLTVCVRLRFDPKCSGVSTIYSYTRSHIGVFQLRAKAIQGKGVQFALQMHSSHGPYQDTFDLDDSWHSVCVTWTQDGGRWALFSDGLVVARDDGLNSSSSIGPDGLFIIGQDQDAFGDSFPENESFSGSITELHIWDRVLHSSEINWMETTCSPFSRGLVLKWSKAAFVLESSLTKLWRDNPCQGNLTALELSFADSLLERNSSGNQTFPFESFRSPQPNEECVIFDPVVGNWGQARCDSLRGAVCQFRKDTPGIVTVPKTPFFSRLNEDPQTKSVMEKLSANISRNRDVTLLQHLTQALLRALEAGDSNILTSNDVLYLAQMIEMARAPVIRADTAQAATADIMVSIATNYVKMASLMLEPRLANQWTDSTEGVKVGPFTVIRSIDSLAETLADMLSAEKRDFTLSTKNINVYIKWQKLSNESCPQVFQPYSSISNGGQDELSVPDTELRRIHLLGHKEVMFIHTHYSHLSEIICGAQEPSLKPPDKAKRILPGHLSSAVISATVRDSSKAKNIPVAVKYSLSTSPAIKYSRSNSPVCAFWNFSIMQNHTSSWSSEGCRVTFATPGVTSCLCNHTTNFAVLMNYLEPKWSPEEELILSKLTFIGCGASLCALVVTLMMFTVLDIPKSDRTSIHKNLFIALICAQVILLCSGSAIHNKVACTLVAALLHLFFMAAFSWMLVEGLLLWSKVVAVNLNEDRHMKYYYLIGWGLPVLIVTITLASASGKYSADGYCWLSVQDGVIWGFAGPVIFIIMVNILVLTRVVVITISTARRRSIMLAASPTEKAYEQMRAAVKAVLLLLPILGLTWLCGVLVPFSTVMAYIFITLSSLQGLFIFLIYGVYNTEVRSTVNRIKERRKALNFSNCAISRPSSSVTSSRPVSFPLASTPSHDEETTQNNACSTTSDSEKEEVRTTARLSIPCVSATLESQLSQTTKGANQPEKEPPPSEADAVPAGRSLRVPVELEFTTSCFPRCPAPQQSHDLV
ncbi:adhesion G-protein coupled receptor D2 isoform X1 [Takifugu flavidus]|uniref:adhesion G-protein coupled receptor D2 isoform X1 n=1 Tax=Takifugu flavidus TaxID=433684 RepID=UPI002544B40E|nr:adhesion G-protein coupled receptor D2 isoform X1 [Takifugu flavidus]